MTRSSIISCAPAPRWTGRWLPPGGLAIFAGSNGWTQNGFGPVTGRGHFRKAGT